MTPDEAAEQWKLLKQSKKAIEARLAELRAIILPQLAETSYKGLKLQERDLTTYDENKVWELMDRYAIPRDQFTKRVIEPSLLEQLYYEGTLSDDDLRHIRVPRTSYAIVEEVGEEDVQEIPSDLR